MRTSSLLLLVLVALCVSLVAARSHREIRTRHQSTNTPKEVGEGKPVPVSVKRSTTINPRPIIGVFSLANTDNANETGSIIPAGYVKWLEQAGARIAVVPFNAPKGILDNLFDGINGLLFTGGGLSLNASTVYFQQALYLFQKAMAANDAGDYFPIWGTCQGFQLMHLLAAQPANHWDVLKCGIYDSENLPLALSFTPAATTSQLFLGAQLVPAIMDGSSMHPTIFEAMATQNLTMNLHQCGVNPADFNANPILPTFYTILSTNVDRKGLPFVSTIEGIKYPFFAAQWHAERTQFEWDDVELLAHNSQGVASSSYVSQRWMMMARMNQHQFPNANSEAAALIYNYLPTFTGDPENQIEDQQTYEFVFNF